MSKMCVWFTKVVQAKVNVDMTKETVYLLPTVTLLLLYTTAEIIANCSMELINININ